MYIIIICVDTKSLKLVFDGNGGKKECGGYVAKDARSDKGLGDVELSSFSPTFFLVAALLPSGFVPTPLIITLPDIMDFC